MKLEKSVDGSKLSNEIGMGLGREVALTFRLPGELDEEGIELPGSLLVLDPNSGEKLNLNSTDLSIISETVATHIPDAPAQDAPPLTSEEVLQLRALITK